MNFFSSCKNINFSRTKGLRTPKACNITEKLHAIKTLQKKKS